MKRVKVPESSVVITDKKLYIINHSWDARVEWLSHVNLSSIYGLKFYRDKKDERGNFGSVEIISLEVEDKNKIEEIIDIEGNYENEIRFYYVKNIPHFRNFQRILESIVYEYGNIKQTWEVLRQNSKYQLPIEIELSNERIKTIKKSQKRRNIYILTSPLLGPLFSLILVGFIFIVVFIQLDDEDFSGNVISSFFFIFFVIFAIFISIMVIVIAIYEKIKMKKLGNPIGQLLTIEKNCVYISDTYSEKKLRSLSFNETITMNYYKINKPGNTVFKWYENVEGIKFLSSYDSEDPMMYGPFDHFPQIFLFLFYYLMNWKAENDLLISKDQILKLSEKNYKISSEKPRFPTINFFDSIFNPVRKYFNPGEKVVLTYKPIISFKKNIIGVSTSIIFITIGIIGMIFSIGDNFYSYYDSFLYTFIPIFFFLMIIFGGLIPILGSLGLSGKRLLKHSLYVFTNQKIIVKQKKYCTLTPYTNIDSIGFSKSQLNKKSDSLFIRLKNREESYPFMDKYSIYLPNVPKDSILYDQINELKNRYQNITIQPEEGNELWIQEKVKKIILQYYKIEFIKDTGASFIPTIIINIEDMNEKYKLNNLQYKSKESHVYLENFQSHTDKMHSIFNEMQSKMREIGFEVKFYPIKEKELEKYNLEKITGRKRYIVSLISREYQAPKNKKKRNITIQISLLISTLITIILSALFYLGLIEPYYGGFGTLNVSTFWTIVSFCIGMLLIIVVHEFGHFLASKHHKLDVSYPYLIPGPPPIGMLGAFVSVHDDPKTRNQNFDVSIGGIAFGLIISVILVIIGLMLSVQVDTALYIQQSAAYFGKTEEAQAEILYGNLNNYNLLFLGLRCLFFKIPAYGTYYGYLLPQQILVIHPLAYAGWVGLLISALNLVPISFQDGGHLLKTIFPHRYTKLIGTFIAIALFLSLGFKTYTFYIIILTFPSICRELDKTRRVSEVPNPSIPLTKSRKIFALSLIGIFILLYPLSFNNLIYGIGF